MHTVPQLHKALDTLLGGGVQIGLDHAAVFPEVNLTVHNGVGEVFYIGVSRDGGVDGFTVTQVGQFRFLIGTANIFHGIMELIRKAQALNGFHGEVLLAVLRTFGGLSAQDHFRMVDKVAVDGEAVLVLAQMHPIRFNVDGSVTLLQEQDVGYDLRTGVGLERIVGQTDGTQQLRSLGNVLPDFRGLLIHGVAGGHKGHHATGPYLIQRFCEEVIVNGKTELVISPVIYLILSKGYIADCQIVEVPAVGGFKACNGNVRLGVQLFGDTARDAVQLHTIQAAVLHFLW